MIMLFSAILSAVLFFSECVGTVTAVRERVLTALDGCVLKSAIASYDSLDDGADLMSGSPEERFEVLLSRQFSSLSREGGNFVCRAEGGEVLYSFTQPVIACSGDRRLRVSASFDITFPVCFAGEKLTDLTVTVSVSSSYDPKYR